ncbi:MAG: plasmid replication protein RepC [Bradyrhizobium sp.]|nr:plasmid replication protein RepC [Bradyrhizobium sp.]
MSIEVSTAVQPTGFRRLTLTMLAAREQADHFQGAPKGAANPFRYLAAFQEAEPYLGLPPHAFKLVSWLIGQTMPHDWEAGSRPIAWPSARLQQEFLGLSAARVKALNRALFEAGVFVIRDNEQGKRYGRRGPDKRIIEAFGFDLSPIAQRFDEFIRLAAEAKAERMRSKELRKRITIARRAVYQVGELLSELEIPLPVGWMALVRESADLVSAARQARRSEDLALIVKAIEARQVQAETWLREATSPVDTSPVELVSKPHTTSTNLSLNLKDTVIAAEKSRAVESAHFDDDQSFLHPEPKEAKPGIKLSVQELIQLAPRLAEHIPPGRFTWRDAIDAAGSSLRHELGVSASLWGEACVIMGREAATLALAIVSTKDERHFTRSAGGYFAGMVRKSEKGELFLEKSLWGLRTNQLGRAAGQA